MRECKRSLLNVEVGSIVEIIDIPLTSFDGSFDDLWILAQMAQFYNLFSPVDYSFTRQLLVTTLMEASEKEIKNSKINCAYCRLTFLCSFFRVLCKEYCL